MPAPDVVSPLPWNDVNFLIVTDVHSWIAGHRHPDHTLALDADYGHVLSLHERLAEVAAARGCDLFLVQNGDLNDGTGFSRTPPAVLVPLLQRMPFDALTTGNHELYENENIDYLAQPGGFIDSWNGSFITSNTLDAATGEHLGSSHKLLVGRTSRVLAFGFLYDMRDHADHVIVTRVEEAVQQAWFVDALTATEYDAVLFLTHMDFKDPLVDLLLAATRASAGAAVPVLFVTGHSHVRAYRDLDTRAASFEAGRYLDTIGFASFSLSPPPSVASSSAAAAATFAHLNIDANRASMAAAAGLADPASLLTAAGAALRGEIKRAASGLRLSHVLGCAPRTYKAAAGLGAAESLWRLYLDEVTPRTAFGGNASRIAVQSTGSLRYDLYAGSVTLDDVWTMNPFADHLWRVAPAVSGGDVRAVLSALHAQAPSAADSRTSGPLPRYAATSMPVGDEKYELWTVDFDLPAVVRAYESQTGSAPHPVRMLDGSTSTDLWMRYVQQAWPCNGTAAGEDLAGAGTGEQRPNLPDLLLPLLAVFSLALLLALFRFRGCFRRLCARSTTPIRNVQQLVESTAAPGGVAMTAKAVTKS